jgi:hypothetical protein
MWWAWNLPKRLVLAGKNFLSIVADTFAIKSMATHINEAIFQDPTWQGRLIGIFIRIFRIFLGLIVLAILLVIVATAVATWYALPFFAIWMIAR